MMEEMMRELQGETAEAEVRTSLKLPVDIHIPPDYIGDEAQRLQTYRRLAEIREPQDLERLREGLKDRYGAPPQAVLNLMHYALLKSRAERLRVDHVERKANRVSVKFREDSKVDARKLMEFVARTPGASFSPDGELRWALDAAPGPELLTALSGLMEHLAAP
jgi:transcription-repair coupling factor (superfamily II helicase)